MHSIRQRAPWIMALVVSFGGVHPVYANDRVARLQQLIAPVATPFKDLSPYKLTEPNRPFFYADVAGNYLLPTQLVTSGRLPWNPYYGDWQPARGNVFNKMAYPSFAAQVLATPTLGSQLPLLSPAIQKSVANFQVRRWQQEKPIVAKMDYLDQRLRQREGNGFDFKDLVDPGTVYPETADFSHKYYEAHTTYPFKINIFYDLGVPGWWGLCDRLALANLNEQAQPLLTNFNGGICDDVPISRAELEDMISFVHRMPDDIETYGKNRGNITEIDTLSVEKQFEEEILGIRPLEAAQFATMLQEHVREGGRGVIIDESSSPSDTKFPYNSIWNRPVFRHEHLVQEDKIPVSNLGFLLLARYGASLAEQAALTDVSKNLQQLSQAWQASAKAADDAFQELLTSEFQERSRRLGFALPKGVTQAKALATAKADYAKAGSDFQKRFAAFSDAVAKLKHALSERGGTITVEMHRFNVWFPRQREQWSSQDGTLKQRSYHAVQIKELPGSVLTWYTGLGDYPPDLLKLPPAKMPDNMRKLVRSLQGCTPLAALEKTLAHPALQSKSPAAFASFLTMAKKDCAIRHLDRDQVLARFGKTSALQKQWDEATRSCAAVRLSAASPRR